MILAKKSWIGKEFDALASLGNIQSMVEIALISSQNWEIIATFAAPN